MHVCISVFRSFSFYLPFISFLNSFLYFYFFHFIETGNKYLMYCANPPFSLSLSLSLSLSFTFLLSFSSSIYLPIRQSIPLHYPSYLSFLSFFFASSYSIEADDRYLIYSVIVPTSISSFSSFLSFPFLRMLCFSTLLSLQLKQNRPLLLLLLSLRVSASLLASFLHSSQRNSKSPHFTNLLHILAGFSSATVPCTNRVHYKYLLESIFVYQ